MRSASLTAHRFRHQRARKQALTTFGSWMVRSASGGMLRRTGPSPRWRMCCDTGRGHRFRVLLGKLRCRFAWLPSAPTHAPGSAAAAEGNREAKTGGSTTVACSGFSGTWVTGQPRPSGFKASDNAAFGVNRKEKRDNSIGTSSGNRRFGQLCLQTLAVWRHRDRIPPAAHAKVVTSPRSSDRRHLPAGPM